MSSTKPFGQNSMDNAVEDDKPESLFAQRFRYFMGLKGFTIAGLVDALNRRKKGIANKDTVRYLRKDGPPSLEEARRPDILVEAAALFDCSVEDFFTDGPPQKQSEDIQELLRMATVGLEGPKSRFLIDAIELAYGSAIASRPRR